MSLSTMLGILGLVMISIGLFYLVTAVTDLVVKDSSSEWSASDDADGASDLKGTWGWFEDDV